MIHEPEFVRGNQKSYIRIPCGSEVLQSYEYKMCSYNTLHNLLGFQQRSENGCDYLYYEISGMQSLDIYLQTQKLKRSTALIIAKSIVKLCRELSEYALDIKGVVFEPRYIMIAPGGEEIMFLYTFINTEREAAGLEKFLECCIEYLDYTDELLMEKLYGIYERLMEQKDNLRLEVEMDVFREDLMEPVTVDISQELQAEGAASVAPEMVDISWESEGKFVKGEASATAKKELRRLKRGLGVLVLLDIAALIVWRPITLLKIFFLVAVGIVLVVLGICVNKKEQSEKKDVKEAEQEQTYIQEYEMLVAQAASDDNYTQIISVEDSEGVLYNLQQCEPQYIYIGAEQKIIGKDAKKVQVHMEQDGISRIHALVVKEGKECMIEDLNSTNGTWVNEKLLEPRSRHVLKQGDKVRLAGMEYIFR